MGNKMYKEEYICLIGQKSKNRQFQKKEIIFQQLRQHGSGKTAVLVERIIHKIIDEKIDIDKLLVVTFTNAAAAEMRQRVLDAIYKKLEENPEDEHLRKANDIIKYI